MNSADVTPPQKKTICLFLVEVIFGVSTFWLQQFQANAVQLNIGAVGKIMSSDCWSAHKTLDI